MEKISGKKMSIIIYIITIIFGFFLIFGFSGNNICDSLTPLKNFKLNQNKMFLITSIIVFIGVISTWTNSKGLEYKKLIKFSVFDNDPKRLGIAVMNVIISTSITVNLFSIFSIPVSAEYLISIYYLF